MVLELVSVLWTDERWWREWVEGVCCTEDCRKKRRREKKSEFLSYNMYPSTLSLHTRSLSIVLAVVVLYLFSASM